MSGSTSLKAAGPTDTVSFLIGGTILPVASQPIPNNYVNDLEDLATALEMLDVSGDNGHHNWSERRDRVVSSIRNYLIPRIRGPRQPLLVVFAGPTGAGKSTLLNSVAGAELSRTGSLRPTTKSPVVFAAEGRSQAYHQIGGVDCKVVVGMAPILDQLTLVDTPDIDSTAVEHRPKAEALIDNADVVIFVNSAMRYGDLVPWEVLRRAESRGAPIVPVLNRIRQSSDGALNDYRTQLRAEGLGDGLLAVHEHHMESGRQMVPAVAIRRLRSRLVELVESRDSESTDTVASVLSTNLDLAVEVVSHAESRSEEGRSWNLRLDTRFVPDIDRLDINLSGHQIANLNPDLLGDLSAASRFRAKSVLSKNGPTRQVINEARNQIVQTTATAVEFDMRRAVEKVGAGAADDRFVTAEVHRSVLAAVHRWVGTVDESVASVKAPFGGPALVLGLAMCLQDDEWIGQGFETVAPGVNQYAFLTGSRWRLQAELDPVYESLRADVGEHVGASSSSREVLQDARAVIAALIVRKTLAYA
jgi:energy-coupling factor transporter ATP-binding protein EcfA2